MARVWVAFLLAATACSRKAPPALQPLSLERFPAYTHKEVQTAFDRAVANPAATGFLCMLYQAYDQKEMAEACYLRARALEPEVFEWAYYLGIAQKDLSRPNDAIGSFREAVRLNPGFLPARLKLAEVLHVAKEYPQSKKLYRSVIAIDPDLATAHFGLGQVLSSQGLREEAMDEFRAACRLAPAFGAAHYALAMAYRASGDQAGAADQLAQHKRAPDAMPPEDWYVVRLAGLNRGPAFRMIRATRLRAIGRTAEAIAELEASAALDPNNEAVRAALVEAYWQTGAFDRAESNYREALRINPSSKCRTQFAMVLIDQIRYPEALEVLKKALELSPLDPQAHTQLGRVYEHDRRPEDAVREYRAALAADPHSRAANFLLGQALVKTGMAAEGIRCLEQTLDPIDEKTPGYMRELASAYAKAGRAREAQMLQLRAQQMAPGR